MARSRGTLVVRFIGDINDLTQKSQQAKKQVKQVGQGLVDTGKKMSIGFTLPVLFGFKKAVDASSALNESVDANNVIFKEGAEESEAWGRSMAASAGLAADAALGARGAFGNMFKTVGLARDESLDMSKTMVQLAGDMASFSDEDPSDMLERLRSGLSGEAEPLRRFGVLISAARVEAEAMKMGLADANGEVSESAKVQARYAIILKDTAVQQGNFTLTADSVANAERAAAAEARNAAASFGQVLEPVYKRMVATTRVMVGLFEDLPKPVKTGVAALLGIGAVAGPVLLVIGKIRIMRAQMKLLQQQGAMTGLSMKGLGRSLKGLAASLVVFEGLESLLGSNLTPKAQAFAQAFIEGLPKGVDKAKALRDEIARLDQAISSEAFSARALGESFLNLKDLVPFAGDFETTKDALRGQKEALAGLLDSMDAQTAGARAAGGANRAFGAAVAATGKKAVTAGRKLMTFTGMTREEFKTWRADTIENLNVVDDVVASFAGDTQVSAKDIIKSFREQIDALSDYEGNWTTLLGRGIPEELQKQLQEMGLEGAGFVEGLATSTDKDFKRILRQMGWVEAKSGRIGFALDRLAQRSIDIPVNLSVNQSTVFFKGSRIGVMHHGGVFRAPVPGGEGLAFLRDRERVLTPEQDRARHSGQIAGQNNVGAPMLDIEALAGAVARALGPRQLVVQVSGNHSSPAQIVDAVDWARRTQGW